ncbi:hypothetical protein RJT34_15543 [Clitoria ternatea]|uniref:Uncharacterized protein n=1 Tax=Clitoria ternatea TaxID=43366 RepID=A0AAN9J6T8_CLITE
MYVRKRKKEKRGVSECKRSGCSSSSEQTHLSLTLYLSLLRKKLTNTLESFSLFSHQILQGLAMNEGK